MRRRGRLHRIGRTSDDHVVDVADITIRDDVAAQHDRVQRRTDHRSRHDHATDGTRYGPESRGGHRNPCRQRTAGERRRRRAPRGPRRGRAAARRRRHRARLRRRRRSSRRRADHCGDGLPHGKRGQAVRRHRRAATRRRGCDLARRHRRSMAARTGSRRRRHHCRPAPRQPQRAVRLHRGPAGTGPVPRRHVRSRVDARGAGGHGRHPSPELRPGHCHAVFEHRLHRGRDDRRAGDVAPARRRGRGPDHPTTGTRPHLDARRRQPGRAVRPRLRGRRRDAGRHRHRPVAVLVRRQPGLDPRRLERVPRRALHQPLAARDAPCRDGDHDEQCVG